MFAKAAVLVPPEEGTRPGFFSEMLINCLATQLAIPGPRVNQGFSEDVQG
jgi:hypothetical protein